MRKPKPSKSLDLDITLTTPAQPKPKKIDVEAAQEVIFKPNPGPQTNFLSAPEQEVLYGGPLALDTLVVTPHGYRFLSDISIGDLVFTRSGLPTKVVDIPFDGLEESYEIAFSDNTKVIASAGHKWLVGTGDWRKTREPLRVKMTKDLLDFKLAKGRNKYFVPLTDPVQFGYQSIKLDPYFVGAMLGDGCLTCRQNMTLTGIDLEIVDHFKLPLNYSPKRIKGTTQWKFTQGSKGTRKPSAIWDAFCDLGLAGTNSFTKFIPKSYLFNSVEVRVALLQGLMDTDGTAREPGERRGIELKYTTVSDQLAKDFIFLVESLGFSVTSYPEVLSSGNTAHRIYFRGSDICPFKLTRKVSRWKKSAPARSNKYIVDIRPIGVKEVRCITVEDPDHTFLIDNFTVTKNSAGGGKSYAIVADPVRGFDNPSFRGILLRRTTEELRELISISKTLYPKAIPGIKFLEREKTWVAPSGATLWMSYLDSDDDVSRYQGQAFSWVGFDELTHWASPFAWNYMRSRLRTSTGSGLKLYQRATTNPGGPGHSFVKKMFIDPAPPNTSFWATDIDSGEVITWPKGHSKEGQPLFKRRFIPATLFDNPYLADDGMYEANLLSLPEHQRKQLLEGNWDVNSGAAFPEFDRKIHVVEPFEIPYNWVRFRAADYGYGSNTGVLWFAVSPSEQIVVYRELYCSKVTAWDLADLILEAELGEKIRYGVLDSSLWHNRGDRGPSLAEQMISKGCRWRPSDRSRGSRVAGKNEIHRRLQVDPFTEEPRLIIFDSCRNLISQLPSIPLDKNNPEDVDTNAEDHLYDALRYGIMSRPKSSMWDYDSTLNSKRFKMADATFGY